MPINALRSAIRPPEQVALLDHWLERRGERAMPARADIDPIALGRDVLPHVGLLDVLDGGRAFRYRLVGTAMNRLYGRDYTGHLVHEAKAAGYAGPLAAEYRRCAAEAEVRYFEALNRFANGIRQRSCRILLPLSADGHRVDMILFSTIAEPVDGVPPHLRDQMVGDAIVAIEPDYPAWAASAVPGPPPPA